MIGESFFTLTAPGMTIQEKLVLSYTYFDFGVEKTAKRDTKDIFMT